MEVREYLTANDKNPFRKWLNSIRDSRTRARIQTRLDRLEIGNFGDCEPVGEGVSELRLHFGAGYRVYFGKDGDNIVLLLLGGDKGSQADDIKTAKEYWSDYNA